MQLSIIIPTMNRQQILLQSVELALAAIQDFEAEIIVVNDGNRIDNFPKHEKLTLLENPKQGAASARNYGAAAAKYNILFFIDDDMWITRESLTAISRLDADSFFDKNCTVLNWQFPDILISEMKQDKIGRYLLNANYHTMEGRLKERIDSATNLFKVHSIGSGSFVISKTNFLNIGRYEEAYVFQGEDIDLSNKLNNSNIGIYIYSPVTCYHNQKDRLEINEFLDREYRGFFSQFKNNKPVINPGRIKKVIFTILMPFNWFFLQLFKIIPNNSKFDSITFRTIGVLSSIMYFKAMYKANENKFEG